MKKILRPISYTDSTFNSPSDRSLVRVCILSLEPSLHFTISHPLQPPRPNKPTSFLSSNNPISHFNTLRSQAHIYHTFHPPVFHDLEHPPRPKRSSPFETSISLLPYRDMSNSKTSNVLPSHPTHLPKATLPKTFLLPGKLDSCYPPPNHFNFPHMIFSISPTHYFESRFSPRDDRQRLQ